MESEARNKNSKAMVTNPHHFLCRKAAKESKSFKCKSLSPYVSLFKSFLTIKIVIEFGFRMIVVIY